MESPASADPSKQAAHYTQAEEAVPIGVERPFSGSRRVKSQPKA
jgi:hypothetical protein